MKVFFIIAVLSAGAAVGGFWAAGAYWAAEMDRGGNEFMNDLTRCDNCEKFDPFGKQGGR